MVRPATQAAIARDYAELSADQRAAAADILRNRDRIRVLEGDRRRREDHYAGAVRDAADRDGYALKGLAPTGRGARAPVRRPVRGRWHRQRWRRVTLTSPGSISTRAS